MILILRIMRLTAMLMLIAFLHVSGNTAGQTVTLSFRDAPIQKVFREIIRQAHVSILYDEKLFKDAAPVTIDVQNASLDEVLKICLRDQPVQFRMEENTIRIEKQIPSQPASDATSPPIDIHGRVTDSLGNPLSGVSVTVKGGKTGTSTDANGNFTLYGVNENATLIFSNVGYEQQVFKLKGKNDIVISLKSHSTSLTEVVVNKGYYNSTQALNTGDVSIVTGDEINKQPVSDPILALEARVPGLYIQQASGAPGAYSAIQIRGQNSIENGSDPLYIVDGVPFGATSLTSTVIGGGMVGFPVPGKNALGLGLSPFNSLNPADIESVVVLKDADATAIYGSRGANGVILITTKKGKAGNTKLDVNVYSGAGKVTQMLPLLNTPQYLQMRHEALANDGLSPNPNEDYDLTAWDTTRYTDWQKVLIGNSAPFTNAQVSLSGGTSSTQFVVGVGYSSQGVVFPGSYSDKKASGYINLTHFSNDGRFHLQITTNYVNDNNNLPGSDFSGQIILAPDAPPVRNPDGTLNWAPANGSAYSWINPLAQTLENASAKTFNLIDNLSLSYEVLPGLKVKANLGYNQIQMDQTIITPISVYPPSYSSYSFLRKNAFGTTANKTWIIEPQITYDRKIFDGELNVLVGSTFQENEQNSIAQVARGFSDDVLIENPALASTVNIVGNSSTIYHYNAIFARLGYTWKGKYLLNLTGRRDGSSRFGPGKQFGNFGAVGAGWIFSREQFVSDHLSFLSFGKLRGSYGITGSDQIGDYQYLSTYTSNYSTYQGLTGVIPNNLANPDLAWEQVKKLEGGIELGFFKDRVLATASYFQNRSSNQLVGYVLPNVTGFNYIEKNLPATVQNTGWEITLNTINVKSKKFLWSSSFNISVPRNKLIAFPNLESSADNYVYAVGQPLSIQYVFHSTGVDTQTGLYSFATKDPNGPDYPQDLIVSKPITQSYYGGFGNSFSYGNFQLDFLFQFVKQLGHNYLWAIGDPPGHFNANQPDYVLSRWQEKGDLTNVEKFSSEYGPADVAYQNLQNSDAAISDASFIRLKNLAFSYSLPTATTRKAGLQTVRIYIQCQNLLTFTGYKGLDPETQGLNLPPLRMFTGGIQVSL